MRHVEVEVLYPAVKDGEKPSVTIIVPDDLASTEVLGIAEQVLARVTDEQAKPTQSGVQYTALEGSGG
ncbi:MAG TPA: hypothetical protein VFA89_21000 [Terriglobales bacterium]|nr:hypothetical protein [Terriglobales bacterium]